MKKEKEEGASRLEPTILYEDKDIVAINKPAGLIVHEDGRRKEFSVAGWLLEHAPEVVGVGEPLIVDGGGVVDRFGIVHRIDRETSGVLLLAKTKEGFDCLKSQFQSKKIKKIYNAFVYGEVEKDFGTIDKPIGRSKGDFRQYTDPPKSRGGMRDAVTHYKVLKRTPKFSFVEFQPETGRTHQIRVHTKSIGNPIVSDRVYAPRRPQALGFERLALHARSIRFEDTAGKTHVIEAPLPPDFEVALGHLEA